MQTTSIGRRVLESIGCENRESMAAALPRSNGNIDVSCAFIHGDKTDGQIEANTAAFCGDAMFHSGRQVEPEGLEEHNIYMLRLPMTDSTR